jgi:YetA-like protein
VKRQVTLIVTEPAGLARVAEPVTAGIPVPRGMLLDAADVTLIDESSQAEAAIQTEALARWSDGSVKWLLVDFQATLKPLAIAPYEIVFGRRSRVRPGVLRVVEAAGGIRVDTGEACFDLDSRAFRPFAGVRVGDVDVVGGSDIVLVGAGGQRQTATLERVVVETRGPLRSTLRLGGRIRSRRAGVEADLSLRLSFFSGSAGVDLQLRVRNPRAARHRGGFWDLGDAGSIFFRELATEFRLAGQAATTVDWTETPETPAWSHPLGSFELYQDSSGGLNWDSPNHVNRLGVVTTRFPGYRVALDRRVTSEGRRASPIVALQDGQRAVAVALDGFWQNFPRSIEAEHRVLRLGWLPRQCADLHELQGGEQKTHRGLLQFSAEPLDVVGLTWTATRLIPQVPREWFATSGVIPGMAEAIHSTSDSQSLALAEQIVSSAVEGERSFFARREIIDEYGWRNFGEIYADHEAIRHPGPRPLVAHYNNQYDAIQGAAVHYARSGDRRWLVLMRDLARHVLDIDIYHTERDRPAYNGGLFWHTEHYMDAGTSTHRSYASGNVGSRPREHCGGGPSNEHNYTTGLLTYYYLTGDLDAREAVAGLADWVIRMDHESRGLLTLLDRRPTGMASMTVSRDYHGPGRGAANSINALLDGFSARGDRRYVEKAEELIRRCTAPDEDIRQRGLEDIEHRWSYTVFLQTLEKYLDFKVERDELDDMFVYARESLLAYARWMAEHEVPYRTLLDKVEIPTETWPAQDIRKANVFRAAARYAPDADRDHLVARAAYFLRGSLTDLMAFGTWHLTRPVVIMMTNVYRHEGPVEPVGDRWRAHGTAGWMRDGQSFVPRFHELRRALGAIRRLVSRS